MLQPVVSVVLPIVKLLSMCQFLKKPDTTEDRFKTLENFNNNRIPTKNSDKVWNLKPYLSHKSTNTTQNHRTKLAECKYGLS